ncbi:MAG: heavy-metal-associated domain-containing protein [Sphingobacteriales bacterium]
MKTLKVLLFLLAFSAGIAKAQFSRAELQVSGLNCALCAKTTEKSLRALPFITDVKPDLMRNIYVLTLKNDKQVNFDQIAAIVHEENFFISSLKATFNFENVKVVNNFFGYGGDTFELMNGAGKTLSGPVVLTLVDNGFAPRSVSKKYLGKVSAGAAGTTGRTYHLAM